MNVQAAGTRHLTEKDQEHSLKMSIFLRCVDCFVDGGRAILAILKDD